MNENLYPIRAQSTILNKTVIRKIGTEVWLRRKKKIKDVCLPFTQVHLTYKVDLMNLFRDKLDRISVRDLLTHLNPGVLSL